MRSARRPAVLTETITCEYDGCGKDIVVPLGAAGPRKKFCNGRCRQAAHMGRMKKLLSGKVRCPQCGHSFARDGERRTPGLGETHAKLRRGDGRGDGDGRARRRA